MAGRHNLFPKSLWMLLLALVALVPVSTRAEQPRPAGPLISRGTRLMVFSPHPDDASLGAGGLIQRVIEAGGRVKVVYMTNGDGFPEGVELEDHVSRPSAREFNRYGEVRRLEAVRALRALGVKRRAVIFLGFPDACLSNLRTKSCGHSRPYRSPFTRKLRPLPFEVVVPHADYCGGDLRHEMERVIARFRPSLLVTTGPRDQHPDHSATFCFLKEALAHLTRKRPNFRPMFLTFVIHYGGWPLDEGAGKGLRLDPPAGFPAGGKQWISFSLTPKEVETKRRAILRYHTQMRIMGRFLMSFTKSNELFLPAN